jgi:hypothetical protein
MRIVLHRDRELGAWKQVCCLQTAPRAEEEERAQPGATVGGFSFWEGVTL